MMQIIILKIIAPVVELVDAADSKSVACKGLGVRVSPGAPSKIFFNQPIFLYLTLR